MKPRKDGAPGAGSEENLIHILRNTRKTESPERTAKLQQSSERTTGPNQATKTSMLVQSKTTIMENPHITCPKCLSRLILARRHAPIHTPPVATDAPTQLPSSPPAARNNSASRTTGCQDAENALYGMLTVIHAL